MKSSKKRKSKKTPYFTLIQRGDKFVQRDIPARTWLVDGVIPHPSIGLWYAYRGTGKTFNAIDFGMALAEGENWMAYTIPEARNVLYIEGEMPLGDLKERLLGLRDGKVPQRFWLLPSEDLAAKFRSINLARPDDRQELMDAIVQVEKERQMKFGLIILDSWINLVRGLDENHDARLDDISEWLVRLRHAERSVLIIHQAGKNEAGGQRGASAREDPLDYSLKFSIVSREPGNTVIKAVWDKTRTGVPDPMEFKQRIHGVNGQVKLDYIVSENKEEESSTPRNVENIEKVKAKLPGKFVDLVTATELDKKQVSRVLKYLKAKRNEETGLWEV